jgi:MFS family permease
VKANQIEKARVVLSRTRWSLPVGSRKNAEGDWNKITNIDLELDDIVREVNEHRKKETVWYDFMILLAPDIILRTTMGILIQFFQQLCGINAFFYYSSIMLRDLGITPDTTTLITGAVSVVATLICSIYIEKIGRRPLQIWGSVGMGFSLVVVASVIFSSNVNPNKQERDVIIVFICLYIVHFSYSYGPIAVRKNEKMNV